ncbi:MAG: LysM peptidoglycan-binding domain-containing protein, partial [Pseudomonadota bacterium]
GDLWERVRAGFNIAYSLDKRAEQRVKHYRDRLTNSSRLLEQVGDKARPYLYFIVTELEKHKLPLELALLPIIESRYDPFAYSPGRASGLWQFIPSTGKRFGLTQDWWQDERRDTITATGSAIQYLSYLNTLFDGDWLLAMAAYNAGQGTVRRAIRKNKKRGKPTDYWSLDLPKETRHYIPKLLAWKDIIASPESYNVKLRPIPDQAYFAIVDIGSQIDLARAAELAEVDIDTIYQLNPAFNRWATDPSPPHDLVVPLENASILEQNLTLFPLGQRMTWRRYIIQPNDSLIKIANQFDTSPQLVKAVNGLKSHRIIAGKGLLIPSASKESEYYSKSVDQRLHKHQSRAPRKNAIQVKHSVARGETLWDIAKHYKVSTQSLARWNNMAPGDVLSVNKELIVWLNESKVQVIKNEKRKLFYTVKQGDSLAYIAQKFQVKISDIKSWNTISQKYIQPGQLLTLYIALTDRQLMAN